MPNKESKSSDSIIGSWSTFGIILCWIVISNYPKEDAIKDGLEYDYNYDYIKLINSGIMLGIVILSWIGICITINKNNKCIHNFLMSLPIAIFAIIICVDLTFMYIIIYHDKSITKAKLQSEDNWKPIMMRVINIIFMIGDFIITFLIGCGCLTLPCMIKNECCNSNNDNIDIVYTPNKNTNPNINPPDVNNRNYYKSSA